MKNKLLLLTATFLATTFLVFASDLKTNFQMIGEIPLDKKYTTSKLYNIDILDEAGTEHTFTIFNNTTATSTPVQLQFIAKPIEKPVYFKLEVNGQLTNIKDENENIKNLKVVSDLTLGQTEKDTVWEIYFDRPIRSSSLSFNTYDNSKLPELVQIVGKENIILNTKSIYSNTVQFAETESDYYKIIFTHTQPLRLENLRLSPTYSDLYFDKSIAFLVVPNTKYFLYSGPVTNFRNNFVNNLNDSNPVQIYLNDLDMYPNKVYVPTTIVRDFDKDSIPDEGDNCRYTANTDQIDENRNGKGDACDDFDYDGVPNQKDNCINHPNSDQQDTDRDTMGDACDTNGESRFTENNKWLQWAALGFLGIVLILILLLGMRKFTNPKQ